MKKIIIILSLVLITFSSCKVKEPCEINNQGDICVTNNLSGNLDVFINETRVMQLEPGEKKCITKNTGFYTLKLFSGTDEWVVNNVEVVQCTTSEVLVP
jgi:hypothetical protein